MKIKRLFFLVALVGGLSMVVESCVKDPIEVVVTPEDSTDVGSGGIDDSTGTGGSGGSGVGTDSTGTGGTGGSGGSGGGTDSTGTGGTGGTGGSGGGTDSTGFPTDSLG
ncbi:MAG: hypothetical protein MK078_12640 [Crocinitomicaceae bacterium]|nr:hypothetical protein [Crocinitomicaceae bacterium]